MQPWQEDKLCQHGLHDDQILDLSEQTLLDSKRASEIMGETILVQDQQELKRRLGQWIKWLLEQERDENPANDMTGENAARNQHDHDVWFLTGTFGSRDPIRRICTVPAKRRIFIPIVHSDASFAEYPEVKTVNDLKNRATQVASLHYNVELVVDEDKFEKDKLMWIESDPVFMIYPRDNVYKDRYGVKGGPTVIVCAAWVALLEPLEEGTHHIRITGRHDPRDDIGVPEFNLNVEYFLDVRNLDTQI